MINSPMRPNANKKYPKNAFRTSFDDVPLKLSATLNLTLCMGTPGVNISIPVNLCLLT